MNITVNAPSGYDIVSVSGGTKSDGSAISTAGEEFSVVYGAAVGIDYNLVIIILVVVIVLLLVLSRHKKK